MRSVYPRARYCDVGNVKAKFGRENVVRVVEGEDPVFIQDSGILVGSPLNSYYRLTINLAVPDSFVNGRRRLVQ
ncbi:hypothetical protein WG66_011251 [Moniliophthora roreri]|nr:hypothetical protein WG66_011251 [Moniliophthora roreri]